jgi:large subunit ribosomal protein L20
LQQKKTREKERSKSKDEMVTAKHKKFLKMAKGFRGRGKNCYRIAKPRVDKSLQYAYISRRLRKRDQRKLWIQQINAGARQNDTKYSHLINGLAHANVSLDRKSLSELAQFEPYSFAAIAQLAERERQAAIENDSAAVDYGELADLGIGEPVAFADLGISDPDDSLIAQAQERLNNC